MKKNIFYIFIFLVFVLSFFTKIQKTEAAQPTINIEFRSADKKETGWLWVLTVETKNVQKGTPVWVYIYKNSIAGENLIKSEVAGNVDDTEIIQYNTGGILEDNTKHIISFMVKSSPVVHGYYANTTGSTSLGQTQNINKEDDPEVVKPQEETDKWDGEYKLLAPLGKLETAPKNIGDYFNVIFNLAIGLCAVLAVVMIVIGGIQYMGDESIFQKTEAKSKIFSAILGLIIALGSYALLNTINPDLLGKNGLKIETVTAEILPLYDRGENDPKKQNGESVRCTPVLSGPCSVENLTTIFGAENAVAMSKICNMESGGVAQESKTDVCKPGGESFSFGLFQVNLASNGILAGEDCSGLFDRSVSGKDAIVPKYTSGFSCKLLPGKETLYNTCKNRLLNTNTNLAIAKSLFFNKNGINNWVGDKKYCASAFN